MDLRLKISKILCIILLFSLGFSQQVIAVSNISSEGLSDFQQKQLYNTFVYELRIIYESGDLKFGKLESRAEVQMTNNDIYQGKFSLLSAAETDTMIVLPIFVNNKTSDVTIQFKASDEEGTFISQMTQEFTLSMIPKEYELKQVYPNPFNPVTTIDFGLPTETQVSIIIYNLQGREIVSLVNDKMEAGYHSVVWNADAYSSGVYFVKMISGEYVNTQMLMLVR